jgi:hypothetical protein
MYVFGKQLEPGILVEIYESNSTGLIIERDKDHLHLWNVLIDGKVHCIHSSKLRRLQ